MRIKAFWIASAAVAALALPAIAQQPAPVQPTPVPTGQPPAATSNPTTDTTTDTSGGGDESAVEEVSQLNLAPPAPPVEYPGWARRNPWVVGSPRSGSRKV